jgi:hypothetical protein
MPQEVWLYCTREMANARETVRLSALLFPWLCWLLLALLLLGCLLRVEIARRSRFGLIVKLRDLVLNLWRASRSDWSFGVFAGEMNLARRVKSLAWTRRL